MILHPKRPSARTGRPSRVPTWLSVPIAAAGLFADVAPAADATLSVRTSTGLTSVRVPPGELLEIEVEVEAADWVMFNAALGRLVLTAPGVIVQGYEWEPPFETGGFTDFSLEGLDLPVAVVPETLEGPNYPIATSDVEFGNFLLTGMTASGPLLRVSLQIPPKMPLGTEFIVAMIPDLITNGFIPIQAASGVQLQVEVGIPSIADLTGDGFVTGADLNIFLALWGSDGKGGGDFDGSGIVDGADLGILLLEWI
jgi:hypothetical protein